VAPLPLKSQPAPCSPSSRRDRLRDQLSRRPGIVALAAANDVCGLRRMFRRSSSAVATSRKGHRLPSPLWSKAEKPNTSTSVRLAAESGQKPASAWRVWQLEHNSEEIQEGGKKGQSRRELSERLDVGRSEMFGGLVPNISGSMGWACGPLQGRHSAQKAVPFRRLPGR
jgi:hypothetical protein